MTQTRRRREGCTALNARKTRTACASTRASPAHPAQQVQHSSMITSPIRSSICLVRSRPLMRTDERFKHTALVVCSFDPICRQIGHEHTKNRLPEGRKLGSCVAPRAKLFCFVCTLVSHNAKVSGSSCVHESERKGKDSPRTACLLTVICSWETFILTQANAVRESSTHVEN